LPDSADLGVVDSSGAAYGYEGLYCIARVIPPAAPSPRPPRRPRKRRRRRRNPHRKAPTRR